MVNKSNPLDSTSVDIPISKLQKKKKNVCSNFFSDEAPTLNSASQLTPGLLTVNNSASTDFLSEASRPQAMHRSKQLFATCLQSSEWYPLNNSRIATQSWAVSHIPKFMFFGEFGWIWFMSVKNIDKYNSIYIMEFNIFLRIS